MSAQGIRAGRAYVEMGTDDSRFTKGLQSAQKRLNSFATSLAKVGAGFGAAGTSIVAPIVGAAFQFQATGDELAKMSQRTGVSVEALSELRHAAGQSDLAFADLGKAITKSQQLIDSAMSGNQGNIDKLAKLGLTAESLGGMTSDQQLEVFADRLAAISDPATRAARAIEIFGEDGRKMLPMLSGGAEGIRDLRAEARALGLQMSTEDANAAANLGDAWAKLTKSAQMIVTRIGGAVAPALQQVADLITPVVAGIAKFIDQNRGLVLTALAVGATLLAVGAGLMLVAGMAAGLSMAIGGIMAAASALTAVLSGVGAVLAFVASPLGLIGTLLVAGAAYWVMYTKSGQAMLEWFASNFGALTTIASETMGGVFNAIKAGNLALAAEIAFTGLKLAVATVMESVLSLFGASIKDMMKMLAELLKNIGTVVGRINEARQSAVNWLTEQIGNAMGVDTSFERQAGMNNARRFTQGMQNIDPDAMADRWAESFDKTKLAAKLSDLNERAQQEADATEASPGSMFDFDFDAVLAGIGANIAGGIQQASSVASVGTFSGQQIAMMGFGSDDLQIRQIEKQEETNRILRQIEQRRTTVE